ncbi:hypothetical protein, partial [Streptomyces sp. SID12501]|uniref:hypothetical protein n=1 Tax=Streptomyces sp. SID12501 TaxID=2706042 RepID=UPI0019414EC5
MGLEKWFTVIEPILLIEMHERPAWLRGIEWVACWSARVLRRPRRFTLGPFQLRGSPWRLELAAIAVVRELERAGCISEIGKSDV